MKKAFTFVEVMLALSIIGVLVSILIPVLDNTKPDDTTINFRKTFFAIEESVSAIINDIKLYDSGDLAIPNGSATDENGRILCYNLANTLNTIGKVNCPGDSGFDSDYKLLNSEGETGENLSAEDVNFRLSNGVAVGGIHGSWSNVNDDLSVISEDEPKKYFITLCVDINGMEEGPNIGCKTDDRADVNRDQFRLRFSRDGKVYSGSSAGANNWYVENLMLINPHLILKVKRHWTDKQIENLVRPASSNNKPDLKNRAENLDEIGYIWVQTGSTANDGIWTFTGGEVPESKVIETK